MTREEFVDAWLKATTERERARLENAYYETVPRGTNDHRHGVRATEIPALLGVSAVAVEVRLRLYRLGAAAEPLWKRIDETSPPMLPRTAVQLLAKARRRGGDLRAAIQEELEIYDSTGVLRIVGGSAVRASAPKTWRGREVTKNKDAAKDLDFIHEMKRLAGQFVESRLDPILAGSFKDRIVREFEGGLRVLVSEIHRAVNDVKVQSHDPVVEKRAIDHAALVEACEVLSLAAPAYGDPLPEKILKSRYKKLARIYHPDMHREASAAQLTSMRERFEAVTEAYRMLLNYNETRKEQNSGDHHEQR